MWPVNPPLPTSPSPGPPEAVGPAGGGAPGHPDHAPGRGSDGQVHQQLLPARVPTPGGVGGPAAPQQPRQPLLPAAARPAAGAGPAAERPAGWYAPHVHTPGTLHVRQIFHTPGTLHLYHYIYIHTHGTLHIHLYILGMVRFTGSHRCFGIKAHNAIARI